ncbi:unnamed protein product [Dicrocoelium dendriticum]|nr:unnamed protein product [Dicrocoelium dendriticum]
MLDPNEDTEWNAILRNHDILPPKEDASVEESEPALDSKTALQTMTVDEIKEKLELMEDRGLDDEDAKFLEEYRRKRIALLKEEAAQARFGCVKEITKSDWKTEVNEAGDHYVVIHIAQRGHALCNLVHSYMTTLARKFPTVKFLRGESCLCIPDFPEYNLPSLLIYRDGDLQNQLVGPDALGGKSVSAKSLEWRLAKLGVLETKLSEDPANRVRISTVTGRSVNRITHGLSDGDDNSDSD